MDDDNRFLAVLAAILVVLSLIVSSMGCSPDNIDDCKCKGEFLTEDNRTFYAEVYCETGNPVLGNFPQVNMEYLGCIE